MKLSGIVLTEAEKYNDLIEQVVLQGLAMSFQAHVWHWQTKSYACHVALGEFYDAIRDSADSVAEQFMGCGNEITAQVSCSIVPFSESAVESKLAGLKKLLLSVESPIMADEENKYHGIADIIINMIQEIDKLNFLLTLK